MTVAVSSIDRIQQLLDAKFNAPTGERPSTTDSSEEKGLARLLPRHYRILDLALAGFSGRDIAQALGIVPQTVYVVMKSPLFQEELARRRQELEASIKTELSAPARGKAILEEHVARAAEVHAEILNDPLASNREKQASADSILDRVLGKSAVNEQPTGRVVIEAKTVNLLQLALKESDESRRDYTLKDGKVILDVPSQAKP